MQSIWTISFVPSFKPEPFHFVSLDMQLTDIINALYTGHMCKISSRPPLKDGTEARTDESLECPSCRDCLAILDSVAVSSCFSFVDILR